jgi:hypothetical protein
MSEERKHALDAIIALVEENIDTFAGTDQDRHMLRVLEDLWTMREELETLERGEG